MYDVTVSVFIVNTGCLDFRAVLHSRLCGTKFLIQFALLVHKVVLYLSSAYFVVIQYFPLVDNSSISIEICVVTNWLSQIIEYFNSFNMFSNTAKFKFQHVTSENNRPGLE